MTNHDRHAIELRDVHETGIRVSYISIHRGDTVTAIRDVSTDLPFECVTLFPEGVRAVEDLTDEERAWIAAEAEPNAVDFEGVAL